jgi:GNAT superfamily N-acetyltransferase
VGYRPTSVAVDAASPLLAEGPRAQAGLLLKVRFRSRRATEPDRSVSSLGIRWARQRMVVGMSDSQDQMFTTPVVSVELLADPPHLVPAIGEIRWREWGHPPEPDSLDWWVDVTSREAGRDDLPVTWVAIDHLGQAVGAVGLGEFDIEEQRDRSPWVLGMIIAAQRRGLGIGSQLIGTLEAWAHHRGYSQVWVATGGRAVDFYRKCGWELAEIINRPSEETVAILTKSL